MGVVRGANAAVELVVREPEPGGARELIGELRFPEGSTAHRASVQQIVVAQRARGRPVDAGQIAGHLDLGAAATIERSDGWTRFTMTVPRATRTFVGPTYSFAVGVAVTPDAGPALRLVADVPPPRDGALVVSGLPRERSTSRPAPFFGGVALALAAATTAIWLDGTASAVMVILTVLGILIAAGFRRGMRGFFRFGVVCLRLDTADGPAGRELVVAATGPRVAGGRARLVAVEYEVERSHAAVLAELAAWEAPLEARGDGVWEARVPLPPSDAVPPSLTLTAPRRTVAVRWLARCDVVPPGGGRPTVLELPVTVAVETVAGTSAG